MTKSTTRNRFLTFTLATAALIALLATGFQPSPAAAQTRASGAEELDYAMMGKIREEGLTRSQVMDHISWLSDVYGPRLTGSPAIKQASEWAQGKFEEWGLANIHEEEFEFGKGCHWFDSTRTCSSRRYSRSSATPNPGRRVPKVR